MLSPDQLEQFHRDGFIRLETLAPPDDVRSLRGMFDPLFDDFSNVRGAVTHPGPTFEITRAVRLLPQLSNSHTYRICRDLAAQIFQEPVDYMFDHVLYKPPAADNGTAWHQDEAYAGAPLRAVHFWIALQDVPATAGCMRFVPGSHRGSLLPHQPRGSGRTLAVAGHFDAQAVACPVPSGGATLHGPRTLHATGPNTGHRTRGAWVIHFGPGGRWQKWRPAHLARRLMAAARRTLPAGK